MMTTRSPRGYTLLELIVSLGIFSMVMLVVTGAYITLISLDRQSRSQNQLVASLSFAVESMARNIRTGTTFACEGNQASPDCTGSTGGASFSFLDSEGQTITYFKKSDGTIGQCTGACSESRAVSLTDPLITIDSLVFYVRGAAAGDGRQPQATFVVRGSMDGGTGQPIRFSIQSSATQRLIDL